MSTTFVIRNQLGHYWGDPVRGCREAEPVWSRAGHTAMKQ